MNAGGPPGERPVVRVDRPAAPGLPAAGSQGPSSTVGHRGRAAGAGARGPLRLSRAVLAVLLVAAFGAGVGLSELRRQQNDRDAADLRGSELHLGAILLERDADAERAVLRVQVQNRGPEPVRLLEVSGAGTTIRSNPAQLDRPLLLAGEDRSVTLDAPLGCSNGGASLTVPGRLMLRVTAEPDRGGPRTIDVSLTTPPFLDALADLSPDGLDPCAASCRPSRPWWRTRSAASATISVATPFASSC